MKRYSMRELSLKYNISRTALFKRINKIPNFKNKYMIKHFNMWLINSDGAKLLSKPKQNSTSKYNKLRKKPRGRSKQIQPNRNYYIKLCDRLTESVRALSASNKSLASSNKKLSDTNNQQKAMIKRLRNNNNSSRLTNTDLKKTVDHDAKLLASSKHRNLFQRIFHKL